MKPSLLAAALLVAASGPASAQDKTELKWKFQKDQELLYRTTQKNVMDMAGQAMKQEMSTTISMTVTEVDEKGVATITAKYVALAAKSSGPQEYDYDSEKDKEPPAEPPVSMMAKLVGQSFTMKMNPAGRVVDVKGFEKIVDVMIKGAGDDETQAMVKQMMKQMFSDEAYKGMMQQLAPPLPEEKVAKGDTWSSDFTVKMPFLGGMKFVMKSKLNDLKDDTALIDQEITVELKPAGAEDKDNPLAGMIEIKGAKGKSSSVFSLAKGHFLSQKGTMEMTVAFAGQEMPIKTETELRLVEKKKNF